MMSAFTRFPSGETSEKQPSFLVIGYGNPLRGDDGIGQKVAEIVETWDLPNIGALPVHQLMPELAETITAVDGVIFVDAQMATESEAKIQVQVLSPSQSPGLQFGHYLTPGTLLTWAETLYQIVPQAWLISVPATDFTLRDCLSEQGEAQVQAVLEIIEQIVNHF